MRNLACALVVVGSAATAHADGPVGVLSTIGGWDSTAPGHQQDDGFLGGVGYQLGAA